MEESNNKVKKHSSVETIIWMMITAVVVFIVTSFQYTKLTLGNEDYYVDYYSGDKFKKLEKVLKILENDYLYDYDMETLEEGAIKGMLDSLEEPYTSYFNASDTKEFLTETEGEYEGIGVYISLDTAKELVIVLTPIKGSPAEEAGVLPGDYILAIDDESLERATLEEVSSKIKGKEGTTLKIKFARYNEETEKYEEIEKEIPRRKIELNSFEYKVLEKNIGYISFESFDEKAGNQFKDAIKELVNKNKVKGLIIDLRNNSGGLLTAAQEIIDELLPTGVITYTVDKKGEKSYLYSDSKEIDLPIIVIVNEHSASAAEIMAAAIKDSENGAVVGMTTYGKGLVQEFKSLRDGTYVKVTISEYFSPKGTKINEIGVEPNYIIEDDEETNEDEQLEKAIEVMKNMI